MPYIIANRMGFIQKGTSYARRIVAQASTTNKPTRSLSVVKPMPMNNVVVGSLSYWKERVDVDVSVILPRGGAGVQYSTTALWTLVIWSYLATFLHRHVN